MALNDKLINYGNLAEFHNQILNDTGVTTVSTWSSYKLDGELASKQDTLVAGDGIQISGNTISATGGGAGGDAIEDVQALPDAEQNKNKLVRLASDKKVYVSECSISTEEVIAPDSEQIDNAYITDSASYFYYKGTATIIDSSNQQAYNVYRWYDNDSNYNLFTVYDAYTILNYALEYDEPYDESELEYYTDEIQAYTALFDEGGEEFQVFFNG